MKRPKLPKQWRHWCRLAKLKPQGGQHWCSYSSHASFRWYYLEGRGHFWKVDYSGFRIKGRRPRSEFIEVEMPKTRDQFLEVISTLIKMKETNENLIN